MTFSWWLAAILTCKSFHGTVDIFCEATTMARALEGGECGASWLMMDFKLPVWHEWSISRGERNKWMHLTFGNGPKAAGVGNVEVPLFERTSLPVSLDRQRSEYIDVLVSNITSIHTKVVTVAHGADGGLHIFTEANADINEINRVNTELNAYSQGGQLEPK